MPSVNAAEAAVVEDIEVIPVSSLAEAVAFFAGHVEMVPTPSRLDELFCQLSRYGEDYADVRGQEMAKRALIIAAAGAHNLLMLGPPGSGKTVYIPRRRTDDPAAGTPGRHFGQLDSPKCQPTPLSRGTITILKNHRKSLGHYSPPGSTANQIESCPHSVRSRWPLTQPCAHGAKE